SRGLEALSTTMTSSGGGSWAQSEATQRAVASPPSHVTTTAAVRTVSRGRRASARRPALCPQALRDRPLGSTEPDHLGRGRQRQRQLPDAKQRILEQRAVATDQIGDYPEHGRLHADDQQHGDEDQALDVSRAAVRPPVEQEADSEPHTDGDHRAAERPEYLERLVERIYP